MNAPNTLPEAIPLEEARSLLLTYTLGPPKTACVSLFSALHRIAAEDLRARFPLPPFDNSPLDGFALRHSDSLGASADTPVFLRVVETLYAGDPPQKRLAPGECARVMTGAPLPEGTTCVIPWEDTDNHPDRVGIFRALGVHQNYRFRGEVLPQGALILRQGEEITAPHLGLLAAQGFEEILVFARPRVGILSTGSELMSGGAPLAPGKIYDSNRYFLAARAADLGAEAVWAAPTADDPQLIAEALAALGERCDLVISTGGVSLGDHDYLPQAGAYLGARPLFRRVAMKPGGWVTALYWDGKIMLCLSGNPLAAAMSFDLLAGPVIRRLAGAEPALPSELWGVLQDPFPKASPVGRFVYARRDGAAVFLPRARAASLTSLLGCNCILTLPQGTGSLVPGAEVALIPL